MDNSIYSKIIEILAATGWSYVLQFTDGNIRYFQVACWALVEAPNGARIVRGIGNTNLMFVDELAGFDGYYPTPTQP